MKIYTTIFILLLFSLATHGQNRSISGVVLDQKSEVISSVKVILRPSGRVTYTNSRGEFSFSGISHNDNELYFSSIGYWEKVFMIESSKGFQQIQIVMSQKQHVLQEVLVAESSIKQRKANESMSLEIVDQAFITRNLGGSLMATLSRLPGVKTIGIGSGQSKPLVRGLGFNRVVVVDKGIKHEGQQWGADHGLEIDQFAAREVERLKGAASFMYGSGAIAGVIKVLPFGAPQAGNSGGSVDSIGRSDKSGVGTECR